MTVGLFAKGPTNGSRLSVPCCEIHLPALRYSPPSRLICACCAAFMKFHAAPSAGEDAREDRADAARAARADQLVVVVGRVGVAFCGGIGRRGRGRSDLFLGERLREGVEIRLEERAGALVQGGEGDEPEDQHQPGPVDAEIGEEQADGTEAGERQGPDEGEDPHPSGLVSVPHVAPGGSVKKLHRASPEWAKSYTGPGRA